MKMREEKNLFFQIFIHHRGNDEGEKGLNVSQITIIKEAHIKQSEDDDDDEEEGRGEDEEWTSYIHSRHSMH